MTINGWLTDRDVLHLTDRRDPPSRSAHLYVPRVRGRRKQPLPRARSGRSSAGCCGCTACAPKQQTWVQYTIAMLVFSAIGIVVTYLIQRTQARAAWNPQHLPDVGEALAFNTASSFATSTNWQSYVPEATMSYFTQMAGLAWHNFTSAAVGIGVALVVARGLTRQPGLDGEKSVRQLLRRSDP